MILFVERKTPHVGCDGVSARKNMKTKSSGMECAIGTPTHWTTRPLSYVLRDTQFDDDTHTITRYTTYLAFPDSPHHCEIGVVATRRLKLTMSWSKVSTTSFIQLPVSVLTPLLRCRGKAGGMNFAVKVLTTSHLTNIIRGHTKARYLILTEPHGGSFSVITSLCPSSRT